MPHGPVASSALRQGVALAGGLVFAGSLGYFGYCWSQVFDREAGAWSAAGWLPVTVNAALFTVFALHHSWLARAGVKSRIKALVSPALERSTYVWVASLLFIAVCAAWQPVPGVVWSAGSPAAALLRLAQAAGVALTGIAARRMDVLELAGVRQVMRHQPPAPRLLTDGVYGWVRHPIYLGWLLLVWPSPMMTGTRFVFALISTIYLVVATAFEERDLGRTFDPDYAAYRRRVRWRMVPFVY